MPTSAEKARQLAWARSTLGALITSVGVGHLAAWLTGHLTLLGSGAMTMKTNAALGLLLSGLSLLLLSGQERTWKRRLSLACATVVALVAGLTLTENLFDVNLGIDQILAREAPGAMGVLFPNRMGTPASLGLTLAALALLLVSRGTERAVRVAQGIALAILTIGLLGTIGFLYDVRPLHTLTRLTAVSWPSAASLLALGLAILSLRPTKGIMAPTTSEGLGGRSIRYLLPWCILLPLVVGYFRLQGERLGLYDSAMGASVLVLFLVCALSALVYLNGVRIGRHEAAEKRIREVLEESEERYRTLFTNMTEGFAVGEVISGSGGEPCDFRFVETNEAFDRLTGLDRQEVLGRPMTQVLPKLEKFWVDTYCRVGLTGLPARFEHYNIDTNRHYGVFCYSPAPKRFAIIFTDDTEHRRTAYLLNAIMEGTSDMVAALDHRYRFLAFNQAYREEFQGIFGREIEIGTSVIDALAHLPDDQQSAIELWERALQGETFTITREFGDRRRQRKAFDLRFSPIRDAQGVTVGAAHIISDVTERHRMEAALRESEAKFRAVFERAAVGMGRVSFRDARWIDVNLAFCRMLGYSSDELCARSWPEITHPDDLDLDLAPFLQMAAGELEEYSVEKRFLHKQGGMVWARLTLSLVRNAEGRPDYEIAIIEDITGRKMTEEALRESEQRLRATFDNAGVGIVEVEGDDRFIVANNVACRIVGRTRDELLSMNVHELTWPDDRELSDRFNRELHEGLRDRVDYEKRYIRGDGGAVWAHVTVSAIRDAGGRWIRSITTIDDITARKRAEEELAAAKHSAEHAKVAAEQANRAKDDFLAILSHELRTPLTPVVMGVSMLRDLPDLDSKTRETLDMVQSNIEMEAQLIDDLLDVSRIARGKLELNRRPVELCSVLRQAVNVCRPDIESRHIHFGVDTGPAAPYWIEADGARLQQVFWNLLKNAIKFTPDNGCVGIRCRPDGNRVNVEVNDSGIGIEPEPLARVFNAFEQGERSVTRRYGGLGLGLAISKALVEMHGGVIEAHSAGLGKGATFLVRLPLSAPAAQPNEPTPFVSPAEPAPLRILLVEDHPATARMICMVLQEKLHTVEIAGDVRSALKLDEERVFDVLLSDLGLPDGSGHDLLRELRKRGRSFPAIALSGYGQEDDIQRSREAGFVAHLTKPASREAIHQAVASASSRRSLEDAPPSAPAFDAAVALERCMNSPEMLQEMISFMQSEADSLLSAMHESLDKKDVVEAGRAAHKLKGTVVYLGAQPAKDAAQAVESAARAGDLALAAEAVAELERQISLLKAELASSGF